MKVIRIESNNVSYVVGAPSREQAVAKGIELLGLQIDDLSADEALVAASKGAEVVVIDGDGKAPVKLSNTPSSDPDLASTMSQFDRG